MDVIFIEIRHFVTIREAWTFHSVNCLWTSASIGLRLRGRNPRLLRTSTLKLRERRRRVDSDFVEIRKDARRSEAVHRRTRERAK